MVAEFFAILKPILAPPARRLRKFLTAELHEQIADLRAAQSFAEKEVRRALRAEGEAFANTQGARGRTALPGFGRRTIHQFHSGSAPGDAVTNAMFLLRGLLRREGYRSEIFVQFRDPALEQDIRLLDDLPIGDEYVLIVHHSMGHDAFDRVASLACPKILFYHNITPPDLLEDVPPGRIYAIKGREQLRMWRGHVAMALANSAFSLIELRAEGYQAALECPVLFDIAALERRAARAVRCRSGQPFTVLFVGRVQAAKGQVELVDAFACFRKAFGRPCRLVLVGRFESEKESTASAVKARIARHGLADSVLLAGWVPEAELDGWYRAADLYVSLSRHEGFGVPLVEAMAFGVPVLAWPAGAVPYTLDDADALLAERAPDAVARAMLRLAEDPALRAARVAKQRATLDRFRLPQCMPALSVALTAAGARPLIPAATRAQVAANLRFAVTGHINKTYSLAAINRSLARALEEARPGMVRVLPVEGEPTSWLDEVPQEERPAIARLALREAPPSGPEIAISQHYPVFVPRGPFDLKLAFLAWEESLLPASMIATLAGGFDGVLAPSRFVAKALVDSGLSIAVATVGQAPEMDGFRAIAAERKHAAPGNITTFLHVSSAFPRKGADVLLAAFARAFPAGEPVRLVIKTFPNPHNAIEEQIAEIRARFPHSAEIVLISRDLTEADMLALYREADAMVLPTRGEGFNLPALEAMVAGIPLIVTGFGGHRDFCGPDEARLVTYRFARSKSHLAAPHALWVEPDEDDLVAALREFRDPEGRAGFARRAAAARVRATQAAERAHWCRRIAEAVSTLLVDFPLGPFRIGWISSWNVRCGIAEYSRALLEHSGLAGGDLIIFCDDRTAAAVPKPGGPGVRIAWHAGASETMADLARAISEEDPAAVVVQHQPGLISWPALAALLADPRLSGRLVVLFLHSLEVLFDLPAAERADVLAALRGVSRVVVHRLADLNRLNAAGCGSNITLLPHGAAAPKSPPLVRALSPGDPPLIGCHGFFLRHKGIGTLIEAIAALSREWPGTRLRLVTAEFPIAESAAEIARCQSLAVALGIGDRIEWHTEFLPIERVNELLRGCDLVVLPYRKSEESASGAFRTALVSLVPLAVSDVSIFEEAEEAAARVSAEEPAQLAEAISALLGDRQRRQSLQAAAASWLEQHDWGRTGERFSGMLRGLVAEQFVQSRMAAEEESQFAR